MHEAPQSSRPLAKWVRSGAHRILDPEVNVRLDLYLSKRFKYRSRTQWVVMIEAGRILINGVTCRASQRVRTGDQVEYLLERKPEPAVRTDITTLYEDDSLLVVDKPPNLPVHPSGRYFRNTLLSILLARRGETLDTASIRIAHRIDRETSGIVLFGKSRQTTFRLATQFERRTVEKDYLVLVHGVPVEDRYAIEAEIGPNPASCVRKAVGIVPQGSGWPAETEFEVLGRGSEHSLLRARPRTGRLHQIRVHSREAGFPVVGDKLYGLDEGFFLRLAAGNPYSDEDRARLILDRQGLHAHRLTIQHPTLRVPITFIAPLPDDLRSACMRLGIPVPSSTSEIAIERTT